MDVGGSRTLGHRSGGSDLSISRSYRWSVVVPLYMGGAVGGYVYLDGYVGCRSIGDRALFVLYIVDID